MSNKYYEVYDDGTRNWYSADISTSYIRDKTKAFLEENDIYYYCGESRDGWLFECFTNKEEELMLDKFFKKLGVSIYG